MIVRHWLNKTIGKDSKGEKITILMRLAELISVNKGSIEIMTFGKVEKNNTHWKRVGLTIVEAMQLQGLSMYLKGMIAAIGNNIVEKDALELIQNEINRQENSSNIVIPTSTEIEVLTKRTLK